MPLSLDNSLAWTRKTCKKTLRTGRRHSPANFFLRLCTEAKCHCRNIAIQTTNQSEVSSGFRTIDLASTTTECWSARSQSYIGVTDHWIDAESTVRVCAVLARRHLTGSHNYDVLEGAADTTDGDYSLRQKVCKTTSDVASNFMKAFSVLATKLKRTTKTVTRKRFLFTYCEYN